MFFNEMSGLASMPMLKNGTAAGVAVPCGPKLKEVLANRRWRMSLHPFPHVTAENVFVPEFYRELEDDFRKLLVPAAAEENSHLRLTREIQGHAAHGLLFPPDQTGPLGLFTSRDWHDLLARLTGIQATGDVNAGIHHHPAGSPNGRIHNDLNPGWFADHANAQGINVYDGRAWDYKSGATYGEMLPVRETVRGAAMLFYLGNPPWTPGHGGETGLYSSPQQAIGQPAVAVPPVNNSLVVFECTPHSYHSFVANRYQERNSVILWLHRSKAEVVARWGGDKIVYWPAR
jgi:hypothetical protein